MHSSLGQPNYVGAISLLFEKNNLVKEAAQHFDFDAAVFYTSDLTQTRYSIYTENRAPKSVGVALEYRLLGRGGRFPGLIQRGFCRFQEYQSLR